MPIVSVFKDELDGRLGKVYTQEEFEKLCFDFGIELDDVTSEKEMARREKGDSAAEGLDDREIYKIDVPANRYDILCLEGLCRSLNVFLQREVAPTYTLSNPSSMLTMTVSAATGAIRPYVVCAVLRNVTFNKSSWNSFLNLQDKLHQNICRKRTLVAIGTHDLDNIKPPFSYEALPPKDISFVPLTQTKEFTADKLMEFYETDASVKHIKPYVPIIKDSPVYPVIYDAERTVLSLPPIINGEASKMSEKTTNVFIESTATDLTKANIVLATMVAMFSEYCATPFEIEPVRVVYADGTSYVSPDVSTRKASAKVDSIKSVIGVNLPPQDMCTLLDKMMMPTEYDYDTNTIISTVPCTRSDILQECDIIEDVAIAFGYNNIPTRMPKCATVGRQQPMNHLTDLLRLEMAAAGYTESLTMALLSTQENFTYMRQAVPKGNGGAAVIANPKNADFQIARTTLLPGLLKTLQNNKSAGIKDGVKLFEISDVVLLDDTVDVGARNQRNLAAMYTGPTSGFEIIHGLLDRVMAKLNVVALARVKEEQARVGGGAGGGAGAGAGAGSAAAGDDDLDESQRGGADRSAIKLAQTRPRYALRQSANATYFPGRAGDIVLLQPGEAETAMGQTVGQFGTMHPEVLRNFGLKFPVSAFELNLEPLL